MAPHSSTLAWKIPWMEEPGRLQPMGSLSWTWLSDFTFTFHFSCIGEGNGNPLQCSCLENPKDGRAWWAAIYGVAQSQTWLKWLSSSPILCNHMNCSTPVFPFLQYLPEFAQTYVHWVGDAIHPSHPLSPPFPLALNLFQHQGLFQWVSTLHQVAEVLKLQHQSFQWIFRVDFL